MDVKTWTKSVAIAKVKQAFTNYGLSVELNPNITIYGDLIASWKRNQRQYLIFITPKLSKAETQKEAFKATLEYCKANGIKLLVVAWEYENRLYDYVMDLEDEADIPLGFKLIEYSRLETLNKEWQRLGS